MPAVRPPTNCGLPALASTVPVPGTKPVGPYSRRLLAGLAPLVQPKSAEVAVRLLAARAVGASQAPGVVTQSSNVPLMPVNVAPVKLYTRT